jgi:3-hydroxyisobutyrate dehydrogenase
MARNLVRAGLPTTVWDRSAAATAPLADAGAMVAPSATEAVRTARVVITMLPTADVAPVSGSKGPAESGSLLILASGPPEARQVLEPVFEPLGRTVWLGEAGQGSKLKLVVKAIGLAGDNPPPILEALSRQWHAAVAAGHGRQDISAARLALRS